jgi:hypothetical protein
MTKHAIKSGFEYAYTLTIPNISAGQLKFAYTVTLRTLIYVVIMETSCPWYTLWYFV